MVDFFSCSAGAWCAAFTLFCITSPSPSLAYQSIAAIASLLIAWVGRTHAFELSLTATWGTLFVTQLLCAALAAAAAPAGARLLLATSSFPSLSSSSALAVGAETVGMGKVVGAAGEGGMGVVVGGGTDEDAMCKAECGWLAGRQLLEEFLCLDEAALLLHALAVPALLAACKLFIIFLNKQDNACPHMILTALSLLPWPCRCVGSRALGHDPR